ncbi:alpha amylase C-terminal domain-containing protein [Candidatus Saccharibacteria bacterium]|nr:alpha amylase C-terminal domain-containing protein [Candidatus Saccharibacteria bacterium]
MKKNLGAVLRRGGVEFRVWAPFAKHVAVVGNFADHAIDMTAEGDGYWYLNQPDVKPGQTYQYKIITQDDRELYRNDPRARALTGSENGSSVIVANDFDWGDDIFLPIPRQEQIIYELHVGTFARPDAATTATLYDAIEKLDHLESLGVNMIELMPITSMVSSHGWGYAPNHIYSVENSYGGRHGLMSFVRACHDHGIGVVLDVVYNHFDGNGGLWQFDGWSENNRGGIYFYNDWRGDTPWGGRPDYGRPEVRQFILDNIVMWFNEYRVDGLRIDSTIYMRNTAARDGDPAHDLPDAWKLLGDITTTAHKVRPGSMLISEDFAVSEYITKPASELGCGFDAQWGLGFPYVLRDALGLTYGKPADLSTLIYELNHRFNGDTWQKIIFTDSHDTAANGSVRLNEAADPNGGDNLSAQQRLLTASAITMTAPGIPMLLQGQEFMQEGAFNDWQALEWNKIKEYSGIVLAHQHLISLRRNIYGVTAGLVGQSLAIFHQNDQDKVLGYHRWDHGGPGDDTLVLANFGSNRFDEYIVHLPLPGTWYIRFNSTWRGYSEEFPDFEAESVTTDESGYAALELASHAVLIMSQDA